MSDLAAAVEDYLAIRRSVGFTLDRAGKLLPDFVAYLDATGAQTVAVAAAAEWAMKPAAATPAWWAQRLAIVRGFARYLHAIDESNEIPPTDLLPSHKGRLAPYLYSDADIAALMSAAGQLVPAWRAACYQTLIGLLATTGLRLGEALGLDRDDVDLPEGWLRVRHGKRGRWREVAVHESTVEALSRYCRVRDQQWPQPVTTAFFVSMRGARLGKATVHDNFRALVEGAGLAGRGARRWPRPHDLRHSFAVRTVLGWYRDGTDVDAQLPTLSTWLGHVEPANTYWYLQASPELLGLAAERLEQILGALP